MEAAQAVPGQRPVLAVVNGRPVGDGVGYVGLLLHRALDDAFGAGSTRVVALNPESGTAVRPFAAASFLARLAMAQLAKPPVPVVFNHLGIARAELKLPRALRRPYAVFLHGVEAWDPAMSPERRAAVRGAAVRLCNLYTAPIVTKLFPEFGPVTAVPLALLPDRVAITPSDERHAGEIVARHAGPRAVIVGRMSVSERYKGHDELLECWSSVRAAVPGASLIIVGKGDDTERLRAKALSLGLGDAVTFTGFLTDGAVDALLRASNLFVMPSRGEGFGLAYLVAMRAGLPCLGSTLDAAQAVIAPGESGLLVDPDDRARLAQAIASLLGNETLARQMGEAGRRREREVFSYARFRSTVLDAIGGSAPQAAHGPPLAMHSTTRSPGSGSDPAGER